MRPAAGRDEIITIFVTDTNRALFLDEKESASIARIKT